MMRSSLFNVKAGAARNTMASFSTRQNLDADQKAKCGKCINPYRNYWNCAAAVLSDKPLFLIITIYAIKASAIHLGQALQDVMSKSEGSVESGELVTREKSAGRLLSQAVFARWSS